MLLTLIVHQVAYCLFKEHVTLLRLYYGSIKALLRLTYCLFKEHALHTLRMRFIQASMRVCLFKARAFHIGRMSLNRPYVLK